MTYSQLQLQQTPTHPLPESLLNQVLFLICGAHCGAVPDYISKVEAF